MSEAKWAAEAALAREILSVLGLPVHPPAKGGPGGAWMFVYAVHNDGMLDEAGFPDPLIIGLHCKDEPDGRILVSADGCRESTGEMLIREAHATVYRDEVAATVRRLGEGLVRRARKHLGK